MTTSTFSEALCVFDPTTPGTCSIDVVAHLTGVPRHRIGVYCRAGLLAAAGDPGRDGWRFDPPAIRRLRRVETLRERFGDNLAAIKLILELSREVEELHRELRELRMAGVATTPRARRRGGSLPVD